jgi:hypothetical protein
MKFLSIYFTTKKYGTSSANVNIVAKGTINWLSKPHEPINDNLTGCWQRQAARKAD